MKKIVTAAAGMTLFVLVVYFGAVAIGAAPAFAMMAAVGVPSLIMASRPPARIMAASMVAMVAVAAAIIGITIATTPDPDALFGATVTIIVFPIIFCVMRAPDIVLREVEVEDGTYTKVLLVYLTEVGWIAVPPALHMYLTV